MASIETIEAIGPEPAQRLRSAGIRSTRQLLARAGDTVGRRRLAATCHVSEKTILKWAKRADLLRVRGVGGEFSDLLDHIGVDTARELAKHRADRLYATCVDAARATEVVRRPPSAREVEGWIAHAKTLTPAVTYS